MADTFGLVLAGGQSSRMGQDKAKLVWQNIPLFQHMQNLLLEASVDQVLLSGSRFGTRGLPDRVPGKGPLSGIHAVIHEVPDEVNLLVVPVDMPLLPAAACRKLILSASEQQTAVIFNNFTLPMILPVNSMLRETVQLSIDSQNHKDYSLWRLFRRLNGVAIPLPKGMEQLFKNTNTPEDWQSAQRCHQQMAELET